MPAAAELGEQFDAAAARGERLACVEGCAPVPQDSLQCGGCARVLRQSTVYAVTATDKARTFFCEQCRADLLGPACRRCNKPTSRDTSVIALDSTWHRDCFRCEEDGCDEVLADGYLEHQGSAYCRRHYLAQAGERCGKCGEVVDGGLRAMGKVWHAGCLTCEVTGEALKPAPPASAWLVDGKPIADAARRLRAARCGGCGEPALNERVFALGKVWHRDCFRCVHSREVIGERRFVLHDDEPYLEGCYQKLFGASAEPETRARLAEESVRYALTMPLLPQLGTAGLSQFSAKHAELLPHVRRALRLHGVTALQSFVFLPPTLPKPSLMLTFTVPRSLDLRDALPDMLRSDRHTVAWEQHLSSGFDPALARGNPWYGAIAREIEAREEEEAVAEGG